MNATASAYLLLGGSEHLHCACASSLRSLLLRPEALLHFRSHFLNIRQGRKDRALVVELVSTHLLADIAHSLSHALELLAHSRQHICLLRLMPTKLSETLLELTSLIVDAVLRSCDTILHFQTPGLHLWRDSGGGTRSGRSTQKLLES